MPYEVTFIKHVSPSDTDIYINECCYGGDVVSEVLLPAIRANFDAVEVGQEDWGWFIWTRQDRTRLAVDIFCDSPATGAFRVHLTSREHRRILPDRVRDTSELEELKRYVVTQLSQWVGEPPTTISLDRNYMPLDVER